jgi:predicted metal-dependent enzyme (double-stranded beta helix superfamily)
MITAVADYLDLARQYAAQPFTARFDPSERWYQRLAQTDDLEVWLLTWLPGQGTDLHDHGDSAGGFLVVAGELTEQSVTGTRLNSGLIHAGDGRDFGSNHIHRLTNTGRQLAVSVHVYGPALRTMTKYTLDGGQLRVVAVEEAGKQW